MLLQLLYVRGAAEHVDKKCQVSTSMQEASQTCRKHDTREIPTLLQLLYVRGATEHVDKKGLPRSKMKGLVFSHVGYA
jgi:hypothetical protein